MRVVSTRPLRFRYFRDRQRRRAMLRASLWAGHPPRSPSTAVQQDAEAVKQALKRANVDFPVVPLIVFTNPAVTLSVKGSPVKVLRLEDLPSEVCSPGYRLSRQGVELAVSLLTEGKA